MDLNKIQALRRKMASVLDEWETDLQKAIHAQQNEDDDAVIVESVKDKADIAILEFAVGIVGNGINRFEDIELTDFPEMVEELKGVRVQPKDVEGGDDHEKEHKESTTNPDDVESPEPSSSGDEKEGAEENEAEDEQEDVDENDEDDEDDEEESSDEVMDDSEDGDDGMGFLDEEDEGFL